MTATREAALLAYFDGQIAQCAARSKALSADDRQDEARFEQVRANIFDVFKTVFSTALRSSARHSALAEPFFREKLDQIPANWSAAYRLACQHGEVDKAHLERVKLETAEEIKQQFEQIWEAQE